MRMFQMDGPLFSFLNKMADLCILNLLFILCCIPVITIGASCTALYTVTHRMAEHKEGYIAKSFLKAFGQNFKQSTIVWIPSLLVLVVILFDIRIFSTSKSSISQILLGAAYLMFLLTVMYLLFVFPLLAKFSNTTRQTVKNAFLMEIRHLPYTACILLVTVLPWILVSLLPGRLSLLFILWLLFGCSLTAYWNSMIFHAKIFCHYIHTDSP